MGGDSKPGVIYARYSSHAQRDCSIEQQVEAAQAHAKELGIQIVGIYADRAVSGKTDKRPEFQRMLRDAEKGNFSFVVSWKSNRIGRNMLQAMVNEERLREMDVKCIYVEEDFDDNAAGRFALRSMMNVNQFYIENMAEDIRRGLIDSAKQAKFLGYPTYGYKKGPDKKYAIDEPKAEIVREIFTRVANGEAHIEIIEDFNARGIPSPRGKKWMRTSFQKIIRNDRYTGMYRYAGIEIPGGMPRIISDELFYKAQEVLMSKPNPRENKRRRTGNGSYLLTGKLYCGKCGDTMTGISGRGRHGDIHFYYVCNGKRLHKGCTKQNVRRDVIEMEVGKAILEYAMSDRILDWIGDAAIEWCEDLEKNSNVHLFEDKLEATKKSMSNIMKAIEAGIFTDSTAARLKELEAEKIDLEKKIIAAKYEYVSTSKEEIMEGLKMFRNGNLEDRSYLATLIDTFVKAVYVYDDTIKVVFFYSDQRAISVPLGTIKDAIDEDPVEACDFPSDPADSGVKGFVLYPQSAIRSHLNKPRCYIYMSKGMFIIVRRISE